MKTNKQDIELSDTELNQLLSFASKPQPSADFEARLMEKLQTKAVPNNVIAFPQARKTTIWLTAFPLAASLILGIWLGSSDSVLDYLPISTQSVAQSDTPDSLYNLTEDNLS